MKKLLYFLMMLPMFSFSQNVPTPGFEDWYIGNVIQRPQGWITSNIFSVAQFGTYSVEPDWEHFVQGQTSCKLSTYQEHPDSFPQAAFITNGQPLMDYETMTVDFITGGSPFPYKPAKMLGFYQYHSTSPEEDFAQARVILKKYNESSGKRDTIGFGENLLLNPTGDFILFEVPINYLIPDVTPDSIVVIFYSTYPDIPSAGAELWLDSLHFDFTTSTGEFLGKLRTEKEEYFKVAPNPAKDQIYLEMQIRQSGYLELLNSDGKLVYTVKVFGDMENLEIDISLFSSGLYILQLFNEQGEAIQAQKLVLY